MKFEEALVLMREGKKITHKSLGEDVYFQACRVGFVFENVPFEEQPISIVKMKGECQHTDMFPLGVGDGIDGLTYSGTFIIKKEFLEKPCRHGNFPQLNLLLVMADNWEIVE